MSADPLIPLFEGEQFATAGESENFAEGEGASWCVAFTEDGAPMRELRQPDPDGGGWHARVRPQGRALWCDQEGFIEMHSLLPKGVKLMPDDVFSRASFVLSAKGAGPAVPGPDQGAAELPRRAAPGVELRQAGAGAVAEPACRAWQEAGRAGHQAGPDAPACGPEGREAQGLRRRRAARQADRLREPRSAAQRDLPGRGRLGGRQRQDGPRQRDPGHPAPARQGAERLGGRARPAVQEQRDPRHLGGTGRRPHGPRQPRPPGLRYGKVCILSTPTWTARTSRCCC